MRKTVREVRDDTGGFVADEVAGLLKGFLAIPVIIAGAALVLFFILGFTTLLGGPMGFFKVLFVLGAFIFVLIGAVIYPLVRFARRSAGRITRSTIRVVENEFDK